LLISNQKSKRNIGSAAKLIGNCYLLNIYLKDQESSWPDEAKQNIILRMDQAVNFIKGSAASYNIDVTIDQESVGFETGIEYPGIIPVDMFENVYWSEKAFKAMGFLNGNEIVKDIRKRTKAQQVALVFHVNKLGRSYNISYCFKCDSIFYAERAVMFNRYDGNILTYSSSYAHEILHCFGAGELYFPFDSTKERYELAKNYFCEDVMFRVDSDINRLSIGEYTAYRIGWLNSLNRKYREFEDYC